ncbi:uncharacterized protein LOC129589034 [Paramacrobiotus metropolitanus]|uniref:uncharacterized protein LOC129589034 n=1 Tax=Paramacrobiotus metropolitanus TaxID=2943436 RepID=UPI002445DB94|nr:uncharacterized protein LOC129589034 [Paramacrobiotus metropolitanus]
MHPMRVDANYNAHFPSRGLSGPLDAYSDGRGDGGDADASHQIRTLAPPFTDLSIVSHEIYFPLSKKQATETALSSFLRGPSTILIDAGTPKVMSRLYGGVFPDWTAGGLWRNSSDFIQSLNGFAKARENNHKLVVAFDASIDIHNISAWLAKMEFDYENIREVFVQVQRSNRPPIGKGSFKLWFPPTCLQTGLRLICLSQQIEVVCTLYEHEPELVMNQPPITTPTSVRRQSWLDKAGAFFTNSLEYFCYSDGDFQAKAFWGESLKLNMRGDRMTGKRIIKTEVAKELGIREQSLDAGLLYYGTRYFLDAKGFDPVPDLHHEMQSRLAQCDYEPNNRLKRALEELRKVHTRGVNCEDTSGIGNSLIPSVSYISGRLRKKDSLPPHFEHLAMSVDVPEAQVEAEVNKLKDKSAEVFLEVGFRLLDGANAVPPAPYFKAGQRVTFPHQRLCSEKFLTEVETTHRKGLQHEWFAQLLLAEIPTIRIPYTIGDRGKLVMKLRDDPKEFFRPIRRRAYGLIFGLTSEVDQSTFPTVHEVYYGGVDAVTPLPLSSQISAHFRSCADLWNKRSPHGLLALLKLVLGERMPARWEAGFVSIPEWTWVPVIALRYMLHCEPRLLTDGYLDAILATVAALGSLRLRAGVAGRRIDENDRTQSDGNLVATERSITFASYFMTAVDHVIFVNDIVGGLISPVELNPCNYFDGNVFHTKLAVRSSPRYQDARCRYRLEDLLGREDQKVALFLKLRSVALAGISESDLAMELLDAEMDTVRDLLTKRLITETPAVLPGGHSIARPFTDFRR